jgi:phosphatidylserine/phosphatidylglycerophosphate/cardiolipin synthase-like enzyme
MTEPLLDVLVKIGTKYGEEKVALLVKKLSSIETVSEFAVVSHAMRSWMDRSDLDELELVCEKAIDTSTKECVAALKAASAVRWRRGIGERVELVWTGPSTPIVSTRKTESVLLETIEAAEKELFVVSYVAYDVDGIVAALREALERGVRVNILMESTGEYGGRISMDSIALFQRELPEAILYWWREEGASVHAKCAVADGRIAFVTSANLTGAAMERNMELGVKIEGGELPKKLLEHLEALVTTGKIERVE